MGGAMSLSTKPVCDCVSVLSSLSELASFLRSKKKKKKKNSKTKQKCVLLAVRYCFLQSRFKAQLHWKALVECLNHLESQLISMSFTHARVVNKEGSKEMNAEHAQHKQPGWVFFRQ